MAKKNKEVKLEEDLGPHRMRMTVTEARTYYVDKDGNEIDPPESENKEEGIDTE